MSDQTSPPDADAIVQADQRLHFALTAAGIGTWHLDLQTQIATYDESLNRLFGLDPIESRASFDTRLTRIHPDDRARVAAAIERAVATRADFFTLEFRIVRPDGDVRWLRDRGRVLTDGNGTPIAATGAVTDITESRRIEERDRILAESARVLASATRFEEGLEALVQLLSERCAAWCAIHLLDDEGIHRAAGCGDERVTPAERLVEAVIRTATPSCDGETMAMPLRVGATTLGALVLAAGPRAFDRQDVAFASELADRLALSIDRARLFRDLERANRIKDEFLATLSHELRTPLNAVLGWTRILQRGSISPDRVGTILETIERNASAQMQLVEELLDLSAMAAGGLRLSVTRVDLRDIVGGAIETIRPAADAKSLTLRLSIADGVGEIAGDPARLRQVLWNLLANAVKFTPARGDIDLTVADGPTDVEIAVRDTGPGISREFLPHVFEPFRQGESSSTRVAGGLGLGLAIVRHIVEAHGGTVTAHSDGEGCGSVFTVRLPSGRGAAAVEPRFAATLRGRRVLAVDDDESTQELVATMLVMYGVSVRTAGRAAQAMQILGEWRPDVLLADIAMPGEDGYTLLRRIRSLPPPVGSIPAVALTAYTDPESVQHIFAAGFDGHLGKPLEPHVLADALSKVLRLRPAS
jgi:PAS domain S-box-containing protein